MVRRWRNNNAERLGGGFEIGPCVRTERIEERRSIGSDRIEVVFNSGHTLEETHEVLGRALALDLGYEHDLIRNLILRDQEPLLDTTGCS